MTRGLSFGNVGEGGLGIGWSSSFAGGFVPSGLTTGGTGLGVGEIGVVLMVIFFR
jgi:hypothetical protein